MNLVPIRHHMIYGSTIFAKPNIFIHSIKINAQNDIKFITVPLPNISVSSIYKPPNASFIPSNLKSECLLPHNRNIVIGDFNSHSSSWGYTESNGNSEAVENWTQREDMVLIHNNKLPSSSNSGRWKKEYNNNLILASESISQPYTTNMEDPHSKHTTHAYNLPD